MPAGKVLIVMLVSLLSWGPSLRAVSLKRSSEAQPLGTRRTVSLWVLRPLAAISNAMQLTKVTRRHLARTRQATRTLRRAAPSAGPRSTPHRRSRYRLA